MTLINVRFLQLVLLILSVGYDSIFISGTNALPFSSAGHSTRRWHADSDARLQARVSRPRIGIVVKGDAGAPHFGGSAFNIERGVEDGAVDRRAPSNATIADLDVHHSSQRRRSVSAFDVEPGASLHTLPLTRVDNIRVKAARNFEPMAEFKRHLNAANQKMFNIQKRRVAEELQRRKQEAAAVLPEFGEPAILLDPTLQGGTPNVTGVNTILPHETEPKAGPNHWRSDVKHQMGHGPAILRLPEHKRLLGGLIGSLGGDSSGTPSGFGTGGGSNATSAAESDPGSIFDQWSEPMSKVHVASSKSQDGKGYPLKNLQAATSAAITGAQPTTAEQSLGLDIEANDVGYIATIQIGSNHKPFRMLIDSGSADTWVAGSSCTACGDDHQRLGPDTSSSFSPTNNKFQITYGTGSVSGLLGHDDVTIAGLKLRNHTLGVALQQSRDFTEPSVPFDGLMGLARSQLSNAGTPTPIDALFASGQVSAPVMGYRLGRVADGRNDGEVTFGGVDKQRFSGELIEVDNVSRQGFWEAAMDKVSFAGRDLALAGRTAILDTGTTLIVAPKRDADAVHAAIPGSKSDGQGGYYIPCTTRESLALTFGGVEFPIDPRDMLFLPVDQNNLEGDCISAISSGQVGQENEWLVGAVWLKNLYFATNSRTNTIGLGKLK